MTTTTRQLTIEVPKHLEWRLEDAAKNSGLEPAEYVQLALRWAVDPHHHFNLHITIGDHVADGEEQAIHRLTDDIARLGDVTPPTWWARPGGWTIEGSVRDLWDVRTAVRNRRLPGWRVDLIAEGYQPLTDHLLGEEEEA